jgi:hypothetical protein
MLDQPLIEDKPESDFAATMFVLLLFGEVLGDLLGSRLIDDDGTPSVPRKTGLGPVCDTEVALPPDIRNDSHTSKGAGGGGLGESLVCTSSEFVVLAR